MDEKQPKKKAQEIQIAAETHHVNTHTEIPQKTQN